MRAIIAGAACAAFLAVASAASAAPPVITTVGQQSGHPWASWTLPTGVESAVVEVATSPSVGTDGYFFSENVADFDTADSSQTYWLSSDKLDPGTYYLHVGGIDYPCFMADNCPVREFSATLELVVPAAVIPPAVVPKYSTRLTPTKTRPRKKVRASFRDSTLPPSSSTLYEVCWKQGSWHSACTFRTLSGPAWNTWTVRAGSLTGRIKFTWKVSGKVVGKRSVKVVRRS